MKKIIIIASLVFGLGTSVFAAAPVKPVSTSTDQPVSFGTLADRLGFAVKVDAEKSVVIIYDNDHNVIFKDNLSKGLPTEKGYVINRLDYGDYTVEVKTETADVVKQMHVYDDGSHKDYFFMQ